MSNSDSFISKISPYYRIIRPLNCTIGFFSLFVASIVVVNPVVLLDNIYLAFIGAIIMYLVSAGGFVINDIFDIEIDKINTPHRILPSGQMSLRTAYIYTLVLFTIAIILSLYAMTIPTDLNVGVISPLATFLGIIALILYAGWLKRMGFIGNFVIALLTVVAFLIAGSVINNPLQGILPMVIVLSMIYSREIIKDIMDVKGDVEGSSGSFYSLPALIGVKKTVWLARITLTILVLSCFSPLVIDSFRFYKSWSLLGLGILYLLFALRIFIILRGSDEEIIKNAVEGKSLLKIGIIIGLFGLGGNAFTPI